MAGMITDNFYLGTDDTAHHQWLWQCWKETDSLDFVATSTKRISPTPG